MWLAVEKFLEDCNNKKWQKILLGIFIIVICVIFIAWATGFCGKKGELAAVSKEVQTKENENHAVQTAHNESVGILDNGKNNTFINNHIYGFDKGMLLNGEGAIAVDNDVHK